MRARRAYQIWTGGGALAAVALLAVAWFFLIGPQRAETSARHEETDAARAQVTVLEQRLVELAEQKNNLPEYEARLEVDRAALPATPGMPDFLRELQTAGNATGVSVSGAVIDEPKLVIDSAQVFSLSIALTAEGTAAGLDRFLDQLQRVQPRAVLISAVSLTTAAAPDGTSTDSLSMTLSLDAFVAPELSGKSTTDAD